MGFSSKDFGKTKNVLAADLPEKLIHKTVVSNSLDSSFSKERKHPVFVVDLPTKNISMTIGGLEPSQQTNRHRHTYETVIYIIEGEGTTWVEDRAVEWKAGDAIYVPQWAWHHHRNKSDKNKCLYIACENAPQMQNLGVALREEGA
jgi:quercetin dioxygenase-like cupin family protein